MKLKCYNQISKPHPYSVCMGLAGDILTCPSIVCYISLYFLLCLLSSDQPYRSKYFTVFTINRNIGVYYPILQTVGITLDNQDNKYNKYNMTL